MTDKYKMFKNFMFNELGINKEDIRSWVVEAVRDEARKVVQHTYDSFDVEKALREAINLPYSSIRQDLLRRASELLIQKFEIKIEEKNDTMVNRTLG